MPPGLRAVRFYNETPLKQKHAQIAGDGWADFAGCKGKLHFRNKLVSKLEHALKFVLVKACLAKQWQTQDGVAGRDPGSSLQMETNQKRNNGAGGPKRPP